jgi:uncharacterized protein (TIGR00251 family)
MLNDCPYITSNGREKELLVRLHIQPRASRTKILGIHDGRLKIAVTAPPVDGKANKEVIAFLAKLLGLAKSDFLLKSGGQSRYKVIALSCCGADELQKAIEEKL